MTIIQATPRLILRFITAAVGADKVCGVFNCNYVFYATKKGAETIAKGLDGMERDGFKLNLIAGKGRDQKWGIKRKFKSGKPFRLAA